MATEKVIAAILDSGAGRLTIPGLGTFVRRANSNNDDSTDKVYRGDTLVFMDILKGDDGVLTDAVARAAGIPVVAARARVENYVAGLRADLKEKRTVTIQGVGTLTLTESGKYRFVRADRTDEVVRPDEPKTENKYIAPEIETREVAVKGDEKHDAVTVAEVPEKIESTVKLPTPPASKIEAADTNPVQRDVIPDGGPVVNRPVARRAQKRKRIDPVILIALIAIAIAVIVILYGRTVERDYSIDLNEIINAQ